ncbi:MAG: histidinol dehydrogenase [Actinomycetota bacterium]
MLKIINLRAGEELPGPSPVALDDDVLAGTRAIIERVRSEGDAALVALTREFDGADIAGRIALDDDELDSAAGELDPALRDALDRMADRLRAFHARQLPLAWDAERDGVRYGEIVKPLSAAGCYVPGGRASYPSTVLMTVIPARVAGVERVVVTTPCDENTDVPPAVRYAARVAEVDAVFRVGGAQAIAALAYGTESVPRVDKVVGPGNVWVTAAKALLVGTVGIDSLAGPSELVIIADANADPAALAVDLVAQAEHDPMARAVLVTTDGSLAAAVADRLADEVMASPRREIVETAMAHGSIVIARDETEAAAVIDSIAPEHLQIVTADPPATLSRVRAYGAAFLGSSTPVSFGDYGVGSNHVLPTMGNARFASGLRAADFVTISSFTEASPEGAATLGPEIEAVAEAEGLPAHARASRIRRSP